MEDIIHIIMFRFKNISERNIPVQRYLITYIFGILYIYLLILQVFVNYVLMLYTRPSSVGDVFKRTQ